jgi:hypothetical protein
MDILLDKIRSASYVDDTVRLLVVPGCASESIGADVFKNAFRDYICQGAAIPEGPLLINSYGSGKRDGRQFGTTSQRFITYFTERQSAERAGGQSKIAVGAGSIPAR